MLPDERRLAYLLLRLRVLEQRDVSDHELPIVEAGLEFLRRTIRELSHRLHDGDYRRRDGHSNAARPQLPEHPGVGGSEF